jgi:hypothetical protein
LERGFTDPCFLLAFRFDVDRRFDFAFFAGVSFPSETGGSFEERL